MDLKEIKPEKIEKILKYADRVNTNADPVCIQAAITDYCFNKCRNCDHHLRKDKKIINADAWIDFLDMHPGIESVAYLGGDMATYSELNRLMEYHVATGTLFGIVTCGAFPLTTDLELLSYAKWVRVSLDTVCTEIYAQSRGGVSVYDIIKRIDDCIRSGVNIELEITVSKLTEPYLNEVFEFALCRRTPVEVHPMFGEAFSDRTLALLADVKHNFDFHGLDFSFFCYSNFKFKKCVAPYYQIYVDSDGDIYPCCASSGDLWQNKSPKTMGNIWKWEEFLENRRSHKMNYFACKDCCDNTTRINYVFEKYKPKKNFF